MSDLVLFLAIMVLTVISWVTPNPVYSRSVQANADLAIFFNTQRANARLWDGATLYIRKVGDHSVITAYRGQPATGTTATGAQPLDLAAPMKIGGITAGAIFIDPDGTLRVQNGWTPWTVVANPPAACSTSLNVQSTYAGYPVFGTLDCTSTS